MGTLKTLTALLIIVLASCSTDNLPAIPDLAATDLLTLPDAAFRPDLATPPDLLPPGCSNSTKDHDETDVDCGGSCPPCGAKQRCQFGTDCKAGLACALAWYGDYKDVQFCLATTCSNMVQDGDETYVNCGGSCWYCTTGFPCRTDTDCDSRMCTSNGVHTLCNFGGDSNRIQDGLETDMDCGGPSAPGCREGRICNIDEDCAVGLACRARACRLK